MKSITFDTLDDRFVISIEKNLVAKDRLLQLLNDLRIELLADKVDFGSQLEELDETIKQQWWDQNKRRFIPESVL
ncbi:MAG TPA: hypothetical protein PK198_00970 [Saprospiraceae bacterium]|nr:hypothetical protein [Saprospiraceae bacterium]HRK83639.1 hypothetical protein [Saprospiraceae bacterium]